VEEDKGIFIKSAT